MMTNETISPKQEVYRYMLQLTLPRLRSAAGSPWWRHWRNRWAYFEAELVHNLPVSLYEREFTSHDLWFLNVQARWYVEHCSPKLSPLYSQQVASIRELFALVPPDLAGQLQWQPPKAPEK